MRSGGATEIPHQRGDPERRRRRRGDSGRSARPSDGMSADISVVEVTTGPEMCRFRIGLFARERDLPSAPVVCVNCGISAVASNSSRTAATVLSLTCAILAVARSDQFGLVDQQFGDHRAQLFIAIPQHRASLRDLARAKLFRHETVSCRTPATLRIRIKESAIAIVICSGRAWDRGPGLVSGERSPCLAGQSTCRASSISGWR